MKEFSSHRPSILRAFALWAGTDHYSLHQALRRAPFTLPERAIKSVYNVRYLGSSRSVVLYHSGERDCVAILPFAEGGEPLSLAGFSGLLLAQVRKEPSVLLLPLALPVAFSLVVILFNLWNSLVLHNAEFLSLFVQPGCDISCARKVLSIHSLVALLFFLQTMMVALPVALLLFQAPRYRSAINFRMIQGFSFASVLVGAVIFAQLLAFFPFRQYGKFTELGFHPKVEKAFSILRQKH